MSEKNKYSEDSKNFFFNEQNKKKKKKLEEEYGMTHMGEGGNASPEIMNEFLTYVENFEESWKNAESKKVMELMDFPVFKKAEEIEPTLLEAEIKRVLDIYKKFHFHISVIEPDDVSKLDYYKFLTEELTEHETTFIEVPGMNTNFIYEEFHPNEKLDAKDSVRYFLHNLNIKNEKDILIWLSNEPLYFNGRAYTQSEFLVEIFKHIPQFVTKSDILFRKLELDQSKVFVDFILWYRENELKKEEQQKTLSLLIILEKSEFGMFNVKSININ